MEEDRGNAGFSTESEYGELSRHYLRSVSGVVRRRALTGARGLLSTVIFAACLSFSLVVFLNAVAGGWHYLPFVSFLLFWSSILSSILHSVLGGAFKFEPQSLMEELERAERAGNIFSSAFDFSRHGKRLGNYSPYLLNETIRRALKRLSEVDTGRVFNNLARPDLTFASILLVVVLSFQLMVYPRETLKVLGQVSDPTIAFRIPRSSNIVNISGDITVLAGDDVTLEALNFGSPGGKPVLNVSFVPGVWKRFEVGVDTVVTKGVPFISYKKRFEDVEEEFEYFFSMGETRSTSAHVKLLHRPVINRVSAIQEFPEYTGAAPETISTLAGKVVSIAGARIKMKAEVSKPIKEGYLRFTGGSSVPVTPVDSGFVVSFRVSKPDTFFFEVTDSTGLKNDKVVMYTLVAADDRCPEGEIISPPDEDMMPRTQELDITYRAYDDFGISSIRLLFKREGKWDDFRAVEIPIERKGKGWPREIESQYHWSLKGVNILPGDRVIYLLEIKDNNTLSGPCVARTGTRRLVVPSLSQMYARVSREEADQERELDDIFEKSREISESLEKFSQSLKSRRTMDWSLKKQGEDILAKQNELKEKVDRAIERFEETLRKYEENRLTSVEIGRKMEELKNLLEELRSTELKDAIDRFRSLLGEIPEEDVMAALKDVQLDTKKLLEGLDRTVELFKQLLREERMEAFKRRMEEMLDRQLAIRDSTEAGETTGLNEEQRDLSKEAGDLKENIEEFAKGMEDSLASRELEKLLKEMEQAELSRRMEKAADQLESQDLEGAKCTQNGAINQMLSLYSSMGRCKTAMGLALNKEIMEKIEKATIKLVDLSKKQEALAFDIFRGGRVKEREELLFRQMVLKDALARITNELFDVARKSFAVPSAAFARLGIAIGEVQRALKNLEEEKYREAGRSAAGSCKEINSAVVLLLESSSSSSSSGQASQMMQQLFQQQLSISQQIERLMQNRSSGGLSMEEMASLARLAAQQRKAEELLKQIAEEARAADELLGSIDDIAELMKEAAKELDRGELDEELVRRQERILSRMLESQRSLRRRDFKNERVSRSAGDMQALFPDGKVSGPEEKEILLKAIQRAMSSGGPEEYRELIRSYFRALSKRIREKVE